MVVIINLGKTSIINSGLKFFVEFVIIIDNERSKKCKNLYSLSYFPKYTGSQWVILSLFDVNFIDSFKNAFTEM